MPKPAPVTATPFAHRGATRVTRPQLRRIAPPLTATHRPIAHADLVNTLEERLTRAGYRIVREQYAVQTNGLKLFGTFDLENGGSSAGEGMGLALGFRHSNGKDMALRWSPGRA